MRTIILVLAGVFTGYVISNLEKKRFEEIIEDLLKKGDHWLEVAQDFIGDTMNGLEGVDSDVIKMNVDAFISGLTEGVEEFLKIENFNDRVTFIEERIATVSSNLLEKIESKESK